MQDDAPAHLLPVVDDQQLAEGGRGLAVLGLARKANVEGNLVVEAPVCDALVEANYEVTVLGHGEPNPVPRAASSSRRHSSRRSIQRPAALLRNS